MSDSKDLTNLRIDPREVASPVDEYDKADPGDETQRNFAYQHAYGVILLAAMSRGDKPYTALWCEHHDDLLGDYGDGYFDAYQVKTRDPTRGAWDLKQDDIKKSIKRFADMDRNYPGRFRFFYFVSNTEPSKSSDKRKIAFSPLIFLSLICKCNEASQIPDPFRESFNTLLVHCECTESQLFDVLRRIKFILGPSRDNYESVVAHEHIPFFNECADLSPVELNGLRDELMQKVFSASSLQSQDASRYWWPLDESSYNDPKLRAKRISLETVEILISDRKGVPFRLLPSSQTLNPPVATGTAIMEEKLIRGGLADYIEIMRDRALSAEHHLLQLAHKKPKEADAMLAQISSLVQGECGEAHLFAQSKGEDYYGHTMLRDVISRLRTLSRERPQMAYCQEPECLIGIAGLLTAECKVWWSERFDVSSKL